MNELPSKIAKGVLYIAAGIATPILLLPNDHALALIQTIALIGFGTLNIARGLRP